MPEPHDAAQPFVTIVPPRGRRWVFSGGDEDDESVTMDVAVAADGGTTRIYQVRVLLDAAADGSLAASVEVAEVPR